MSVARNLLDVLLTLPAIGEAGPVVSVAGKEFWKRDQGCEEDMETPYQKIIVRN